MRKWNLLAAAALVGLLTAPGLGLINVKLVADQTSLAPGQTTTIHILGQGAAAGLFSLAGDIVASGTPGLLVWNPGSFVWAPVFNPVPQGGILPRVGTPGANGGWSSFGSMQTNYAHPDPNFAKASYVELASYTVTAQPVPGSVTLTFSGAQVSGFRPAETNSNTVMGTITPVTITTPDPATLALLAVGGLLVARRRRA